ncbi:MAG: agmatinase family protein [Phycisphaerales bacterium]
MSTFDPNAAASPDAGVFGLACTREQAQVILMGVPFDATTSYRPGTARGPEAIRRASMQVDLYDHRFGRVYEQGIWMEEHPESIALLSAQTRHLTQPLLDRGGAGSGDADAVAKINQACEHVNEFVRVHTAGVLNEGKTPGLVGGEHAVSLGAIQACADHYGPIGVLQIDAHMDLRHCFEGFRYSHASIMHNVLACIPGVQRISQVGIRDYCEEELGVVESAKDRIEVTYWADVADVLSEGGSLRSLWRKAIECLPDRVYVTFDIDGLDPALCPHTGTPVPGGLGFEHAGLLLQMLRQSGRRIVGFDLVEVAPGSDDEPEWDANVGARILYRLCGASGPTR